MCISLTSRLCARVCVLELEQYDAIRVYDNKTCVRARVCVRTRAI